MAAPEKWVSGRIRVPTRVLPEMRRRRWRDGDETAIMRKEVRIGDLGLELGFDRRRNGDGRGGDGEVKLLRSSLKNLEGGGASVRTSSMAALRANSLGFANGVCALGFEIADGEGDDDDGGLLVKYGEMGRILVFGSGQCWPN